MRHSTWAVRTAISGAAVAAAAISFAVPAQGAPPTVVHGAITFPLQEFDDPDTCASDGFIIHAVEHESLAIHLQIRREWAVPERVCAPRHLIRDLGERQDDLRV